ncbi:unnamed protein product, partial [Prorocentrum cordatum]
VSSATGKEPKVGKHRDRAFDWELIATTLEPSATVPEFLEYGNKLSKSPMQTEKMQQRQDMPKALAKVRNNLSYAQKAMQAALTGIASNVKGPAKKDHESWSEEMAKRARTLRRRTANYGYKSKPPQWFVDLGIYEDVEDSGDSDDGAPDKDKVDDDGKADAEMSYEYGFDRGLQIVWRRTPKKKGARPSAIDIASNMIILDKARRTDATIAEWEDGSRKEMLQVTVGLWRNMQSYSLSDSSASKEVDKAAPAEKPEDRSKNVDEAEPAERPEETPASQKAKRKSEDNNGEEDDDSVKLPEPKKKRWTAPHFMDPDGRGATVKFRNDGPAGGAKKKLCVVQVQGSTFLTVGAKCWSEPCSEQAQTTCADFMITQAKFVAEGGYTKEEAAKAKADVYEILKAAAHMRDLGDKSAAMPIENQGCAHRATGARSKQTVDIDKTVIEEHGVPKPASKPKAKPKGKVSVEGGADGGKSDLASSSNASSAATTGAQQLAPSAPLEKIWTTPATPQASE